MIKYVWFDLDGTLLPMDQDYFTRKYFEELTRTMAPKGVDAQALKAAVWQGMGAMLRNDGSHTNEEVFWQCFSQTLGEDILKLKPDFDDFYLHEFNNVRQYCGFEPKAAETVRFLQQKDIPVGVATLPVFPKEAIEARLRWAGLTAEAFAFCTSYESCRYTKPALGFYRDLLPKIDCQPQECLMVGNNVDEDMIAAELGLQVFLLTDCLINEHDRDINAYPHGGFDALLDFLREKSADRVGE